MQKFISLRLLICCLISALSLDAHAATITGQIKDTDDRAVRNATVVVGKKFDFTDSDGRYRIRDVAEGRQHITIKKGNDKLEESVEVRGAQVTKDITLPR